MAATVDESKCTGCGICLEVCPVEAITVDRVAKIDSATCIDCGFCVAECPNDSISMDEMAATPSARSSFSPPISPIPAMRDETLPNRFLTSDGQLGFRQVNRGDLLKQIFNYFGKPTRQGRGRGKGRGGRGGRGKGRRNR